MTNAIDLIVPKGELRRRARQKNILNDLIKNAGSDVLVDVEIITLKSWGTEQAIMQVMGNSKTISGVQNAAHRLLQRQPLVTKEFVKVIKDRIIVGLNTDEIDDRAVYRAVFLMTQVEDLKQENKLYEFGEEITIEY